jgi:signal transduction histidine kinase
MLTDLPRGRDAGRIAVMTTGRVRLIVLAAAVCGVAAVALILTSDRDDAGIGWAALGLAIGWSFIGTGLYAARRRPESRTGVLMVVFGFAWFWSAAAFSNAPVVFTIASVTAGLWGGVFLQLVTAFPSGRLGPGADRATVIAGYLIFTVVTIPTVLFAMPADLGCDDCPENVLLIRRDTVLADVMGAIVALVTAALFVIVVVRLVRRWRRTPPLERIQLTPVYVCGLGTFAVVVVAQAGVESAFWVAYLLTALLPFAFLAGLLRSHLSELNAELEARVEELRASRARLVEAGDAERRRLERDLHDGAQSRLVAVALLLKSAQNRAGEDPKLTGLLERAHAELQTSLGELRELARGIHPAVLTDRGLEPALRTLADRVPVPVALEADVQDRLPPPVEIAAYFVVSEALQNVTKYANAQSASVELKRVDGVVCVEIRDDGVGGADAAGGSGLRGLEDRVAALDGTLSVDSPPGRGTRLRAEIPLAPGAGHGANGAA